MPLDGLAPTALQPRGSVWPGLIPAGFSPLRLLPQGVLAALPIELVVTLLSAETLTSVRYVLQLSRVLSPRTPATAPCRVGSASSCLPFSALACPFHDPSFRSLHRRAWRIFRFGGFPDELWWHQGPLSSSSGWLCGRPRALMPQTDTHTVSHLLGGGLACPAWWPGHTGHRTRETGGRAPCPGRGGGASSQWQPPRLGHLSVGRGHLESTCGGFDLCSSEPQA